MWLNNPHCGNRVRQKFPIFCWDNHQDETSHILNSPTHFLNVDFLARSRYQGWQFYTRYCEKKKKVLKTYKSCPKIWKLVQDMHFIISAYKSLYVAQKSENFGGHIRNIKKLDRPRTHPKHMSQFKSKYYFYKTISFFMYCNFTYG